MCVFPGAAVMLAELAVEAGLPNGVLNLIHGSNVRFSIIVYQICSHHLCLPWASVYLIDPYFKAINISNWIRYNCLLLFGLSYALWGTCFYLHAQPNLSDLVLLCCYLWYHECFFLFSSFGSSLLNVDLGQEIVNAICDDDDIKAISFVGPNAVSYSLSLTLIQVAVCYHYIDVVKMYNLVTTSNSVVHIQYLLLLCCPSPLLYGLKVIQREWIKYMMSDDMLVEKWCSF